MPFVISSSRKPGAVLSVAVGRFTGTGLRYAALAKLHSIAIYRLGDGGNIADSLVFEQEFPLHATIKYMEAVSIHDPETGLLVRDILFLLSVKQEVSLVAFAAPDAVPSPAPVGKTGGTAESLALLTLYHGAVEGCLYQYFPGETNLVSATPKTERLPCRAVPRPVSRRDTPTAAGAGLGSLTPFVVFGVNRGELFVLDVLAAVGQYDRQGIPKAGRSRLYRDDVAQVRRSERAARRRAFPDALWSLAEERSEGNCISKCALHSSEYEVRDLVIVPAQKPIGASASLGTAGAAAPQSLLVLFADVHGRTHLSSYALSHASAAAGGTATGKASRNSGLSSEPAAHSPSTGAPFQYLEGILEGYDKRLVRSGLLVSNCDPTAAKVLPVGEALLLVGSLLVTLICPPSGAGGLAMTGFCGAGGGGVLTVPSVGSAASSAAPTPVTTELPQGLEFACACVACHDTGAGADASVSECAAMTAAIFFKDGTAVLLPVGGGALRRLDHRLSITPCNAASLGSGCFLVSSRFDSTVAVDLSSSAEDLVVVENVGPVLDLTVMQEAGSVATVVAATGVGKNGGVSLVRTAVKVTEHCSCTLWPLQATDVHQANRLVAITSEYGSRFFCLELPQRLTFALNDAAQPIAAPAVACDVAYDAGFSDAHVMLLRFREKATEGVYYLLDRRGTLHWASLRLRAVAATPSLPASWELVRRGTGHALTDRLPEVLFTASVVHRDDDRERLPASDAIAVSDGRRVMCYGDIVDVGTGSPWYDAILDEPISCLSIAHCATGGRAGVILVVGDWAGRMSVVHIPCDASGTRVRECGGSLSWRSVALAAVPRSVAVMTPLADDLPARKRSATPGVGPGGDAQRLRAFVGLMNGCYQEVALSELLGRDPCTGGGRGEGEEEEGESEGGGDQASHASVVTRPVFIMRRPVSLMALSSNAGLILCRGPSPLLLLARAPPDRADAANGVGEPSEWKSTIELTGLSLNGVVDVCCVCDAEESLLPMTPPSPFFVFLSNYHGCHSLAVCSLPETTTKISLTFMKLGYTVTLVRYVRPWGKFALALRHAEMDAVAFLPDDVLDAAWRSPLSPANSFSLLENERCVFLEPLTLGGANLCDPNDCVDAGDARTSSGDPAPFVLLVGSTFAFPDEQRPRSSRITWYIRSSDSRPTEKVSKDISGQLQCCCPVPHYPGRIALGVSGCILLFSWSATDKTFVAEERLRLGMMVTKLIPLYNSDDLSSPLAVHTAVAQPNGEGREGVDAAAPPSCGPGTATAALQSCIAALDARFSVMLVTVNPVQGGLEIIARDRQTRGIMDGELVRTRRSATVSTEELCMCDEDMNFLCMPRPTGRGRDVSHAAAAQLPEERAASGARPHSSGRASGEGGGARAGPQPPQSPPSQPPSAARSGGAAVGGGVVRLKPSARVHMGDLVTAMRRGSLALAFDQDAALPAPWGLLPGFRGDQLVYGTTHGGLGVISPVSGPTFVFLKAMEHALLSSSTTPHGGYSYASFREVCAVGQARSFNRAVALPSTNLASACAERGVCSGDVVETYLRIRDAKERDAVLRLAESVILSALRSHVEGDEEYEELAARPPSSFQTPSPTELTECNALLATDDLPTIPLQHEEVELLIMNLSRTH